MSHICDECVDKMSARDVIHKLDHGDITLYDATRVVTKTLSSLQDVVSKISEDGPDGSDSFYGPYSSLEEAYLTLKDYSKLEIGRTVGVKINDIVTEYWFDKQPENLLEGYKIEDFKKKGTNIEDGTVTINKLNPELRSDIEKLLAQAFPLELTVVISPTELQKKGAGPVPVMLSWSAKIDGNNVTLDNVKVNGSVVTGSSYADSASDTKQYKVEAEAQGRIASVTKSVTFVYPIYVFFSTTADFNSVSLSGEQSLASSLNYSSKSFTNGNTGDAYLWIVSGYTPKTVQSEGGLTIAIGGSVKGTKNNLTYWRSNDALGKGSWSLTIKS